MIAPAILAAFALLQYAAPGRVDPDAGYYGGVAIDLEIMKERSAGRIWRIDDCSSSQLQCIEGNYFKLAVPRSCDGWQEGDRYTAGDVRTDVLWISAGGEEAAPLYGPGRAVILGNPDQRWSVYVYVGSTLEAAYIDGGRELDLYRVASQGGIEALIAAGKQPDQFAFRRGTLRGILSCNPATADPPSLSHP